MIQGNAEQYRTVQSNSAGQCPAMQGNAGQGTGQGIYRQGTAGQKGPLIHWDTLKKKLKSL